LDSKHKFFILGIMIGVFIPFFEHAVSYNSLDMTNVFAQILAFGGKVWQYVFLYIIVISSIILYVKPFRAKVNPEHKILFLISGVALGFAIISIISATINLI